MASGFPISQVELAFLTRPSQARAPLECRRRGFRARRPALECGDDRGDGFNGGRVVVTRRGHSHASQLATAVEGDPFDLRAAEIDADTKTHESRVPQA